MKKTVDTGSMSFQEALEHTLTDKPNGVITVGVIRGGGTSWAVYGEGAKQLPDVEHTYEIGSISKTFTAALVSKAIREGKLELDAPMDRYLDLPAGNAYPTIAGLLTHTSGLKNFYVEWPMLWNILRGENALCGVNRKMVLRRAGKVSLPEKEYPFLYSNLAFALLGLILEKVYGESYTALMNRFVKEELGLTNTRISDFSGDLGKYWRWKPDDAYMAAGALTSNISDMLAYAQMQLDGKQPFADCHQPLRTLNATPESNRATGMIIDKIGMSWVIDEENGILWHNGGTGHYNSYLGFHRESGTAVVVLANLPPFGATMLGIKKMKELLG
jgi:beta-lactamase class C